MVLNILHGSSLKPECFLYYIIVALNNIWCYTACSRHLCRYQNMMFNKTAILSIYLIKYQIEIQQIELFDKL